MKKMKIWMMSLIAVIFAGTLAVGCAPGNYASIGGDTNECLVYGELDFSVDPDATNVAFQVCFSTEEYLEETMLTNYDYVVLGTMTNQGTVQPYDINLPEGNYYIYAWINANTSGSTHNYNDLEAWYIDSSSNHIQLSVGDSGSNNVDLVMGQIPSS